jgi:hypothetical protein
LTAASCHCGAARLRIDAAPTEVTDCNCSLCRRYGVLWAYYSPRQVRIEPGATTDIYMCHDRVLEFHRCAHCGCVTHWASVDRTRDRMAINARLMDPAVLTRAKVRRLDGADTWKYIDDPR